MLEIMIAIIMGLSYSGHTANTTDDTTVTTIDTGGEGAHIPPK